MLRASDAHALKKESALIKSTWVTSGLLVAEIALLGLLLLKPEFAVAVSAFLIASALAALRPEFAFAVFITGNALPFYLFDRVPVGIPAPVVLMFGVLVASLVLGGWIRGTITSVRLTKEPAFWLSLAIGLLLILGCIYSPRPQTGLRKVFFYFVVNFFLLSLPLVVGTEHHFVRRVMIFAYGLGALLALLSLPVASSAPRYVRLTPTSSLNPIWFARSLGYSSIAAIYLFARYRNPYVRGALAVSMLVFLELIGRTLSRAPFLGVLVVAVLFVLLYPGTGRATKLFNAVLVSAVGIYLLLQAAPRVAARLATPLSQETSTAFRFLGWLHAISLFKSHPLTGVGTGGFFLPLPYLPLSYAHNLFLELASEVGLVGLGLGIAFVVYGVRSAVRLHTIVRPSPNREDALAGTALLGILFYSVWNAMFSGNIVSNEVVWLSVGLLSAELLRIQNSRARQSL